MPEQVSAASVRDEDQVHLMRAAKGQRRRLVRDFLSSKEGNLQNITVDYDLYEMLARDVEHGFTSFNKDVLKEGLQGGKINLPVRRCDLTGRFICGWRGGFAYLSPKELSDDLQLLFGGAKAMIFTWLVAIKEEAAREGLAHEEHIVRLLNQHVEEVIVLDSDDEVDDGRPIGLWRPSSSGRNAIILFFEEKADAERPHLAKKLKDEHKGVSEQEDLEMALALSASLVESVTEDMSLVECVKVDRTLEENLSVLLPGARVLRVEADQDKGELLAKLIALAQNNMSIYLTEPEDADELSRVGAEIAASSVVSIEIGTALLGFAAYRIHEPEHGGVADKKFTYLFELHKDLSDPRTGGLGDLLEAEVTLQAEGVSESMLLTVLRKNDPARRFYNKHGWFRFNKNRKRKSGYDIMVKEKFVEDLEDPGSSVFPHLHKMTPLKPLTPLLWPLPEEGAPPPPLLEGPLPPQLEEAAEAAPVSKEAVPEGAATAPKEAAPAEATPVSKAAVREKEAASEEGAAPAEVALVPGEVVPKEAVPEGAATAPKVPGEVVPKEAVPTSGEAAPAEAASDRADLIAAQYETLSPRRSV